MKLLVISLSQQQGLDTCRLGLVLLEIPALPRSKLQYAYQTPSLPPN